MRDISFLIPTYNAGRHLERCLKSIRGQDYPRDKIKVFIADGGSSDNTLDIAARYGCAILNNPLRLAEYGLKLGMQAASSEFLVPFAADNELVGRDWVKKVVDTFNKDETISAVWGKLVSGQDDPPLNKYFELIQSDPLNWFLNHNLDRYRMEAGVKAGDAGYFIMSVDPRRPLVWGANGLVYRADKIKRIWEHDGYLGDNDAFQSMVEKGDNKVAYFSEPFVYHHHVATINDWIKKWKRNYRLHFLDKLKTRNLNWVFLPGFNQRILLWIVYSLCPLFSGAQACYLAIRQKKIYWLYHPVASLVQTCVYIQITLTAKEGRVMFKNLFINKVPLKK